MCISFLSIISSHLKIYVIFIDVVYVIRSLRFPREEWIFYA